MTSRGNDGGVSGNNNGKLHAKKHRGIARGEAADRARRALAEDFRRARVRRISQ